MAMPRFDDTNLQARSTSIMAKLVEAMVYNSYNQSHNLGGYFDPHALLGVQLSRLFRASDIDYARRFIPPLNKANLTEPVYRAERVGWIMVRQTWSKSCRSRQVTEGMGLGRDMDSCYRLTCKEYDKV